MENRISFYQSLAGVGTGLVVTVISGMFLWLKPNFVEAMLWQLLIVFLLFVFTSPSIEKNASYLSRISFWAVLPLIYVLSWQVPIDVFFIYTVIWVACAPYYLDRKWAWIWLVAVNVAWYFVRLYIWGDSNPLAGTLLVSTFHIFALLSAMTALASAEANEKTQLLNRELLATQHLLGEASRDSERTRIARDLHDLLGHHLTALTINLQVASHLTDGEAKEKVDHCHALSKLLLSDVREAVATLRTVPTVNLRELLEITVRDVPRLNVELTIDEELKIDDVNTAETVLRFVQEAITNTLKHTKARSAKINVSTQDQQIILSYSDSGQGCAELEPGHGLQGMRERIERIGGELEVSCEPSVSLLVRAPLAS